MSNAAISGRLPGCVGGSDGFGFGLGLTTDVGRAVDDEEPDKEGDEEDGAFRATN
jgi:hypothetical protein